MRGLGKNTQEYTALRDAYAKLLHVGTMSTRSTVHPCNGDKPHQYGPANDALKIYVVCIQQIVTYFSWMHSIHKNSGKSGNAFPSSPGERRQQNTLLTLRSNLTLIVSHSFFLSGRIHTTHSFAFHGFVIFADMDFVCVDFCCNFCWRWWWCWCCFISEGGTL